jgi:hypothetical protein
MEIQVKNNKGKIHVKKTREIQVKNNKGNTCKKNNKGNTGKRTRKIHVKTTREKQVKNKIMDFNKTCMDHVYYQWKIHVVDN